MLQPNDGASVALPATESAPLVQPAARSLQPAAVVIQTSFLGDMVLTTPLIAELARRGPVDVVATPASAPLLANNPSVRDVIVYDKRGTDNGLRGLWRVTQTLRYRSDDEKREVGIAYLAQGSVRSAMLALLGGVDERVGFSTSPGRVLYTQTVPYRSDRHHAERLWRLAAENAAQEPTAAQLRPRLYPGANHVGKVDELLAENGYAGEPLVALAPGSIWGTKRWPYFPALARSLADTMRVVVIGGAADAALAREIAEAAGPSTIDSTGKLSLLAFLVTNDSAPQHLASAMDTPTVTVFGPTVPDFGFGPLATRNATIGLELLPCRPCHKHGPQKCPLGHWRCMVEVGDGVVLDAVRRLGAERP
jgi:heptosyltransferase II